MSGILKSLKGLTGSGTADRHGVDPNMRFSMVPAPGPGDSGFAQWVGAMQMVVRLPGGIPPEFRRTLWLTLADKHLQQRGVDWPQAERLCFSEWSNPEDEELGVQIVKDLHRTGCSLFCGQSNQAVLKRVLLAYARWNKAVGYCQGFNMLAALILQVMDRNEPDSVKVMIYLIEGVLPESYFANNLRGLSVDMAVFRDLLRLRMPTLSKHLEHLQQEAGDNTGTNYEPPLTNVFTMQWFLTLFCNCLPQPTVLRVWDLIFLEGNDVLLRTALAIWDTLADRIMTVSSADEFYSIMGVLTREILEFGLMDSNRLIKTVVSLSFPELPALRDKYMYNITPWASTMSSAATAARRGLRLFYTEDDSGDSGDNSEDDEEKIAVAAAFGISAVFRSPKRRGSACAGTSSGPGGVAGPGSGPGLGLARGVLPLDRDRISLDMSALKQQYCRLRERQRQAQIILTAACGGGSPLSAAVGSSSVAMNHLLLGKHALRSVKGPRPGPPPGAVPTSSSRGSGKGGRRPPSRALVQQARPDSTPRRETETLHWKDEEKKKKKSPTEVEENLLVDISSDGRLEPPTPRSRSGSASSSSSTSTELCDDPGQPSDSEDVAGVSEIPPDSAPPAERVECPTEADVVQEFFTASSGGATMAEAQEVKVASETDQHLIDFEGAVESKDVDEVPVIEVAEDDPPTPVCQSVPSCLVVSVDGELEQPVELPTQLDDEPVQLETVDDAPSVSPDLRAPEPDLCGSSPEQVVATVTEKLRLIMEHLEHNPVELEAEGDSARNPLDSPPSEALSSRESRERLMSRLFGREESLVESEASITSLKSSALDLGELLEVEDGVPGAELETEERARSAAGDVEGVTSCGRHSHNRNQLGRQNSEKAMKIIRENSEILQRIAVWQRDGRSLTLPEQDGPPVSPRRSPLCCDSDDMARSTDSALSDRSVSPYSSVNNESSKTPVDEEKDTVSRLGISRTLSREKSPKKYPDLPLAKQLSLDDSSWELRNETAGAVSTRSRSLADTREEPPPPVGSSEKLQLILDHAFSNLEASLSQQHTRTLHHAKYKFPEMSPMTTSPLQPLPGTGLLSSSSDKQTRKWRAKLTPPSTPVKHSVLDVPTNEASVRNSSGPDFVEEVDKPSAKSRDSETHSVGIGGCLLDVVPNGNEVIRLRKTEPNKTGEVSENRRECEPLDASCTGRKYKDDMLPLPVATVPSPVPTALPVQTPAVLRSSRRSFLPPSPSSPSASLKQTGRRKKGVVMDSPTEREIEEEVGSSGVKSPITFNPFPCRPPVRQPKELGIRLGLYPSATNPGDKTSSFVQKRS